jgi:hypothetical protein
VFSRIDHAGDVRDRYTSLCKNINDSAMISQFNLQYGLPAMLVAVSVDKHSFTSGRKSRRDVPQDAKLTQHDFSHAFWRDLKDSTLILGRDT